MNYKKGFFKRNKALVIVGFTIILFFVVLSIYLNKYDIGFSYLRNFYYNVINVFSKKVDVNYNYVESSNVTVLQKRINDLEKMLNFSQTNTTYSVINCNIISYSLNNTSDTLIINKGAKDKINTNMLAINNDGVVGVISKVYKDTSEVKLLTGGVNLPVKINGVNAIIKDYHDGFLIASLIKSTELIEKGNIVTTTSVESNFPDGIQLGEVVDFYLDDVGIEKNVKIKTNVDFYNLHYISILTGNNNDNN